MSTPAANTIQGRDGSSGALPIFTTDTVGAKAIKEAFGLVGGSSVKSRNVAVDCCAIFRSCCGGEITAYTDLMSSARDTAIASMSEDAAKLGANAVVGVRFASSDVGEGLAEVYVYGTAVLLE